MSEPRRRVPDWLATVGFVLLGISAVGLPVALVVAALDHVRREGTVLEQGVVLGGLILAAVVLVVGIERGLSHAAAEGWSLWAVLGAVAALSLLVVAGVFLPGLGLVLVALGVVLASLLAPVGIGLLVWLRWRTGPRPTARETPSAAAVRVRAEERRAAVRARHDHTRRAVAAGLIGPGFSRGRG